MGLSKTTSIPEKQRYNGIRICASTWKNRALDVC